VSLASALASFGGLWLYFVGVPAAMLGLTAAALRLRAGGRGRAVIAAAALNGLGLACGLALSAMHARAERKVEATLSDERLHREFDEVVKKTLEDTRRPK
jgi:hypothetical protein